MGIPKTLPRMTLHLPCDTPRSDLEILPRELLRGTLALTQRECLARTLVSATAKAARESTYKISKGRLRRMRGSPSERIATDFAQGIFCAGGRGLVGRVLNDGESVLQQFLNPIPEPLTRWFRSESFHHHAATPRCGVPRSRFRSLDT